MIVISCYFNVGDISVVWGEVCVCVWASLVFAGMELLISCVWGGCSYISWVGVVLLIFFVGLNVWVDIDWIWICLEIHCFIYLW